MNEVIASFRFSIAKVLTLLAANVFFTLLCGWIFLFAVQFSAVVLGVFTVAGALFFGFGAVKLLKELSERDAVVEVTTLGIRDRRRFSDLVPWTAISGVSVQEVRSHLYVKRFLSLEVRPDAVLPPTSHRGLDTLNRALGYPGVHISMVGLNGSVDDLAAAVAAARAGPITDGRRHVQPL